MAKSVFTDKYKILTAELISARQAAGLTQTQVADRLKRPQSYIAKTENGERRLDLVEFLEFVAAIGADPHSIIDKVLKRRRG